MDPTLFMHEVLRDVRTKRDLSQAELAHQLGVSQSMVSHWETGRSTPTLHSLRVIAEALGVSPLDLILNDEPAVGLRDRLAPSQYVSVFISYGGPDEMFARMIFDRLVAHEVKVFFFPESAPPGQRLHRTMSDGVSDYDRVLLICSEASLRRPGVLNELEQVLAREAREGGAELLIPVTIDDFVFAWTPDRADLANQVRDRVVADFRGEHDGSPTFEGRLQRLLKVLEAK